MGLLTLMRTFDMSKKGGGGGGETEPSPQVLPVTASFY